ncbi:hypothetical protein AB0I49_33740 [Streptomyces sp. NPDC050617]|uniref:hypothetical protein n=1 Tax=Streptomyces sp. NPDC050617 TaxID=3154628 RepID=UPI003435FA95
MGTPEHESAQTRLQQVPFAPNGTAYPPGGINGQPGLASSPAEKKAAAKALEQHIEPDTKKSGDWADEQSAAVVKEFDARDGHGWVTSSAVQKAHKAWDKQVRNLMNRLSSEKSALRSANYLIQGTDYGVRNQMRASSLLDGY